MGNYSTLQRSPGTTTRMIPIRFNQRLGYKKVMSFTLSYFRDNSFSCQVNLVHAHAQPAPLLVLDLLKLLLLRSSMSMGTLADVSSNLVGRKHLLNASDLPPMCHLAMRPTPLILIQKTKH